MKNIYQKVFNVQQSIGSFEKKKINPFYNSSYFEINDILRKLLPILKKEKLTVTQPISNKDGRATLKTKIVDIESGEVIEDEAFLPETIDAQKMGSGITYFRRYCLVSLFLLESEDDDGNATVKNPVLKNNKNNFQAQKEVKAVNKDGFLEEEYLPF